MEEKTGNWEKVPDTEIVSGLVNILISPCGTGKTTAIKNFLARTCSDTTSILVFSFRQTLAIKLAKDLGCKNYMELKSSGYKIDFNTTPRLVISPESLPRLADTTSGGDIFHIPDVMVLDEYMSYMEHIFNDATMDTVRRALFFRLLMAILGSPGKTVILADAYFQDDSITTLERVSYLESIPLGRYIIIRNEYRGEERVIHYTHNFRTWKTLLNYATASGDQKLYVFSNWKSILDGLQADYGKVFGVEQQSYPRSVFQGCYYISSDSSSEQKNECSSDFDSQLPRFNHLYATPTISAGITIDSIYFDRAFGYAGGNSTTPLGTLQLSKRVRSLKSTEVILYCYNSVRVKKGSEQRAPYTDDEVHAALVASSAIVRRNYLECRNFGFIHDVDTSTLVRRLDTKDVTNQFLLEVVKSDLNARLDYIGTLKKYSSVDNYTFVYLEKASVKRTLTEYKSDTTEFELIAQDKNMTISKTMDSSRAYRITSLSSWDGSSDFSVVQASPLLLSLFAFMSEWNVLGAYGYYSDMIKSHLDPNIKKQIQLHPDRCARFYDQYVHGDRQKNFHDYISKHISLAVEHDYLEHSAGGIKTTALEHQLLTELVDIFRIAPINRYTTKTWFGIAQNLSFMGNLWEGVVENQQGTPLWQQDYIHTAEDMKRIVNSIYTEYSEDIINTETGVAAGKKVIARYWSFISTSKGLLTAKDFSRIKSTHLTDHTAVVNSSSAVIHVCCTVVKKLLKKIGLELTSTNNPKLRCVHGGDMKRRFHKYAISNFKGRLMLSVLRHLQSIGLKPWLSIHYPEPDPFRLLAYDPECWMKSPHSNRFKTDRRQHWDLLPEHWKKMHSATGEINTGTFGYSAEAPIPAPVIHAPATLDTIVVFCMFWKYYGNENTDRELNNTLYSPAFSSHTRLNSDLYIQYVYQPDVSRLEISVGGYTSESFDALTLEDQYRVLAEIREENNIVDTP
jgi:hypothetical protein